MNSQLTPNDQTPTNINSQEQLSGPETTPVPGVPGAKGSQKKRWLLIVLTLLLLAVAGGLYWYFMDQSRSQTTPPTTSAAPSPKAPTYSRLVVYSKDFSVAAFDPTDNRVTEIYKVTDAEIKQFCDSGCSHRTVALSPDYSKIAFDSMLKDGKAAFGYYDRATKKVTVLANGGKPLWSPDGSHIAFANDNGVNIMTLATGEVGVIDNTKPQFNAEFGVALPPKLFGWKSNTELIFDTAHSPYDVIFNIGDITTKANREVIIQGVTAKDSMFDAVVSPNGAQMLIEFSKDPGFDVAVVNVDGSGLSRVTGNSAARWAGSGYAVAAFAPDGQTALIANHFIPAVPPAPHSRSTSELEAHDFKGRTLFTIAGHRVVHGTRACWYDENYIYGLFATDQSKHYLGVYDKRTSKVSELDATTGGMGLESISCAK